MADKAKKISELTALTSISGDDLLVIVDDPSGTPVTKKVTVANLLGNSSANVVIQNVTPANGTITLLREQSCLIVVSFILPLLIMLSKRWH